jgi:predicted nucleic acid-binding protein
VGAGRIKAAVAASGPLIHLAEIGGLLLLHVFDTLHIPDAVWSETIEQNHVPQGDVLVLGIVQRHALLTPQVVRFIEDYDLASLHTGEREALFLCQQTGVPTLLTDDLAVREAAKRLNLTPVGSLGIVVRAYRLGHISLAEAERHIAALYDTGSLFVTRTIIELALEQLHQLEKKV